MIDDTKQEPTIHSIRDYIKDNSIQAKLKTGVVTAHKPEQLPRVLVVTRVHHRDTDGKVKFVTSRFGRELQSKEDIYLRKIVVGEQWVVVDTAWVNPVGYLFIENTGGKPFQVIPTPEQLEEERSRIVEVGYKMVNVPEHPEGKSKQRRDMFSPPREIVPFVEPTITPLWVIHPGESMQGKPTKESLMYLRCRNGEVTVNIMATPN